MKLWQIILGVFFVSGSVFAQKYGVIQCERPDLSQSGSTVPRNRLQVEMGFDLLGDEFRVASDKFSIQTLNIANSLFRYGLTKIWELRLATQFTRELTEKNGRKSTVQGVNGMAIGGKVKLLDEHNGTPDAALIFSAELPIGHEAFVGKQVNPAMIFAADWELGDRYNFGANLGGKTVDDWKLRLLYAASLGLDFSQEFGVFVRLSGDVPDQGKAIVAFDGGMTLMMRRNLQVDASFGNALNKEATDWFGSVGFSWRLPR